MERRGADLPADLSVGDPEDRGLRVKVGRPEGKQVFERRTSGRAPLAPEAWKVTSSHRRSAASERRSGPSRSTAQIATSTRPRLSAAWGVPRGSAFSGFAWRCGRVSEAEEAGSHCMYAEAPYRLEQHGQERTALGPERSKLLAILIIKTITLCWPLIRTFTLNNDTPVAQSPGALDS